MRERFSIRDAIKYGLIRLGYAMNFHLFESVKYASTRVWVGQVLAVVGDIDIITVLTAGIKLLASLPLPSTLLDGDDDKMVRRIALAAQSHAVTNMNRITFTPVALGSGFFANAMLLGIPINTLMENEDIPLQPWALQCTKPDLMPTPIQIAVPHHPSSDVIRWPDFHSNVCLALAQDPHGSTRRISVSI